MKIGIYKITNLKNNKVYIGQSRNISQRWKRHVSDSKNSSKPGYDYPLYRAFRKEGIENFEFTILEECSYDELNEKEIAIISLFDATNPSKGYNLTRGGTYGTPLTLSLAQVSEIKYYLRDSDLTQENISYLFGVSQRTISSINIGQTWGEQDEVYPIRKSGSVCSVCGKKISLNSNNCLDCFREKQASSIPERAILKSLIYEKSFSEVGKMFSVSDTAIKKWCKRHNLPALRREIKGYSLEEWQKI